MSPDLAGFSRSLLALSASQTQRLHLVPGEWTPTSSPGMLGVSLSTSFLIYYSNEAARSLGSLWQPEGQTRCWWGHCTGKRVVLRLLKDARVRAAGAMTWQACHSHQIPAPCSSGHRTDGLGSETSSLPSPCPDLGVVGGLDTGSLSGVQVFS